MTHLASALLLLVTTIAIARSPEEIENPSPPYTVETVRAWHKELSDASEGGWPWAYAPEQAVHLRSDGSTQLLLCVGGGARSGEFVLFGLQKGLWTPFSGSIDQAHHSIRRLSHSVGGWHDFQTFNPLWGSGGKEVLVVTYRWTQDGYKEFRSEQGMWCEYAPFSRDKELCGGA